MTKKKTTAKPKTRPLAKTKDRRKSERRTPSPSGNGLLVPKMGPGITGQVELRPIDSVKPNDWNMNVLKGERLEAVEISMREDGWLASEAMLIWGTDEKGKVQDLIINGEHRQALGKKLGYKKAPMVFLHGITRAKAIELTIKLDNNRGTMDSKKLSLALKEIVPVLNYKNPAAVFGYKTPDLNKLLGIPSIAPPGITPPTTSKNNASKTVPLYFTEEQHNEFMERIKSIGAAKELETVTEVVSFCVENTFRGLESDGTLNPGAYEDEETDEDE